jgi:rhamnose utilization protein RhaD (predicted bifunctional aldolase and dehydrogenase)
VTFTARPSDVPDELVALTRRLGDPAADLVVLAEGNTSTRLPGDRFAVKASGARMDVAGPGHFVVGELAELLAVLDGGTADQATLTQLLSAGTSQASIETLVHVAALAAGATWVAHTHPTAVVGLLAVTGAEELWSAPFFPDEAVVLGEPVWVPYAAPGLALGRAVHAAIRQRCERDGVPPRLVLLGNHGIVALGATAAEVETVTTMAVKAARVRAVALAAGHPAPLDPAHGRELAGRPDETARRTMLGRSPTRPQEVS